MDSNALKYEEPPNWRQQQGAVLEGLLASEQELAAELEQLTVDRFIGMASGMLAEMPDRRSSRPSHAAAGLEASLAAYGAERVDQ
jgi:hypothetical protein